MQEIAEGVASVKDVQEIPASAGALLAASNLIGHACWAETDAFLLCKAEHNDNPVKCLDQGKQVTQCARKVLRSVVSGPCNASFKAYVAALEKNNLEFDRARTEEKLFEKCLKQ